MQTRFICHRELSHVSGMIGQLCIKSTFTSPQRCTKHFIQVRYKLLRASHQVNQVGNIVLNIPAINPTVVFSVILTRSLSSGKTIIKRLDKLTLFVFRMKEHGFGIKYMPIIIRSMEEVIIIVRFPQHFCNFGQAPIIIAIAQYYRNSLSFFERMHCIAIFFFSRVQSRIKSFFPIKVVQFRIRHFLPRQ